MANSGVARGVDAASLDVDMALCITRELLFACHAAERPSIFREVARMGPRSWATVRNQAGRAVTLVPSYMIDDTCVQVLLRAA